MKKFAFVFLFALLAIGFSGGAAFATDPGISFGSAWPTYLRDGTYDPPQYSLRAVGSIAMPDGWHILDCYVDVWEWGNYVGQYPCNTEPLADGSYLFSTTVGIGDNVNETTWYMQVTVKYATDFHSYEFYSTPKGQVDIP